MRRQERPRPAKKSEETLITDAIRMLLKTLGIWHWKHWQGPMSYPKGVADILGCYQGRMIAIEVKTPRGVVKPEQEAFLKNVRAEGGIAFVARSVEDVIEGLRLEGVRLF